MINTNYSNINNIQNNNQQKKDIFKVEKKDIKNVNGDTINISQFKSNTTTYKSPQSTELFLQKSTELFLQKKKSTKTDIDKLSYTKLRYSFP